MTAKNSHHDSDPVTSTVVLYLGDASAHFQLNADGDLVRIGHSHASGCFIDDVWSRRERYRNRKPDFLIQGYLRSGWYQ